MMSEPIPPQFHPQLKQLLNQHTTMNQITAQWIFLDADRYQILYECQDVSGRGLGKLYFRTNRGSIPMHDGTTTKWIPSTVLQPLSAEEANKILSKIKP